MPVNKQKPDTASLAMSGRSVDYINGYEAGWEAALADQPVGHVVVTKDALGQIVAVTRQDDEGRILSVISESVPPSITQMAAALTRRLRKER